MAPRIRNGLRRARMGRLSLLPAGREEPVKATLCQRWIRLADVYVVDTGAMQQDHRLSLLQWRTSRLCLGHALYLAYIRPFYKYRYHT